MVFGQELEPRRWAHLPVGGHFLGGGPVATNGDIFFDPVIRAEDAKLDMETWIAKYVHSFEFFERSARVSVQQGQQNGTWSGLLDGVPTTIRRAGLTDTVLRFAVNLVGTPPLSGQEFVQYRGAQESETVVGLGMAVHLPTGEYFEDKLINLGANRVTFRPQLGIVHSRGNWSFETTAAVWLYGDNDEFFGETTREQDPFYFIQSHLVRTLPRGHWAGASLGYGFEGETTIGGVAKENDRNDLAWALSYGLPLGRSGAVKFVYAGTKTNIDIGLDSDSLAVVFTRSW